MSTRMFSRLLPISCVLAMLFLCACASQSYNSQISTNWKGQPASALVASWGQPNTKISLSSGNAYYVYTTQTKVPYPYPSSNPNVIVAPNGQAIASGVSAPPVNNMLVTRCITTFSVNKKGYVESVTNKGYCSTVAIKAF